MLRVKLVAIILNIVALNYKVWTAEVKEGKLIKALLSKYDINQRPIRDTNEAINLKLGLTLQQIIEVNEAEQTVQINAWLQYEWNDYRLAWRQHDYGNLTEIRLPADKLWKPDVLLYNSFDANFGGTFPVNFVVNNTGLVNWIPPGILKSLCHSEHGSFPYNGLSCSFKFGAWTYDGNKVNLTGGDFDSTEYVPSGHWILKEKRVKRRVKTYQCCPTPYIDVQFVLHLERRSAFYSYCVLAPYILFSIASLVSFLVSARSHQKLTFCGLILIGVCAFSIYTDKTMPPMVDFQPMGLFVIFNVTFVASALVCNAIVTYLYHKENERVPDWVRDLFIGVFGCSPRLLRNIVTSDDEQWWLLSRTQSNTTPVRSNTQQMSNKDSDAGAYGSANQASTAKEYAAEREWRMIANIIDKMFFIGFLVALIICTSALLIKM